MPEVSFESLHGIELIPLNNQVDSRGEFSKLYDEVSTAFDHSEPISFSVSKNRRSGTIRGLHIQITPYPETKLVTCLSGSIFDVILDLRPESPTFTKWARIELNSIRPSQLYIPPGFAHGYQTLEEDTEVAYVIWGKYSSEQSRRISFQDTELAIYWPLEVTEISTADREANSLRALVSELL